MLRALLLGALVLLLIPVQASAACSRAVRADSLAAQRLLADMEARGAAGSADARGVFERARRSCLDIRPARAIAVATDAHGIPAPGRRSRTLGVDLIGLRVGAGVVGWRIDLARTASRVAATRASALRTRAEATLRAAGWGTRAITWSTDPTRLTWDPGVQSSVVSILGRSARARLHSSAAAGVRAFGVGGRAAALSRLGLLQQLTIAARTANGAANATDARSRAVARNVVMRTYVRVRASRSRSWSRIDGAWATAAQHRMLVSGATALLRLYPHPATSTVVQQLRDALTTAPSVTFTTIPKAPFYPWPRDGAFDQQQVGVDIDKPARLTLLVYAPDGKLARGVFADAMPGDATLAWDGARRDGTIVDPGEYRYNVDARDLAGNRIRVPGLEQFTVARDTTPPTIVSASMRIVHTSTGNRAIVGWDVDEQHSPRVRSWLVLRSGDASTSVRLHESIQQATVRRDLTIAPGSWRAVIVFIDGSGNRSQRLLGTYDVR